MFNIHSFPFVKLMLLILCIFPSLITHKLNKMAYRSQKWHNVLAPFLSPKKTLKFDAVYNSLSIDLYRSWRTRRISTRIGSQHPLIDFSISGNSGNFSLDVLWRSFTIILLIRWLYCVHWRFYQVIEDQFV